MNKWYVVFRKNDPQTYDYVCDLWSFRNKFSKQTLLYALPSGRSVASNNININLPALVQRFWCWSLGRLNTIHVRQVAHQTNQKRRIPNTILFCWSQLGPLPNGAPGKFMSKCPSSMGTFQRPHMLRGTGTLVNRGDLRRNSGEREGGSSEYGDAGSPNFANFAKLRMKVRSCFWYPPEPAWSIFAGSQEVVLLRALWFCMGLHEMKKTEGRMYDHSPPPLRTCPLFQHVLLAGGVGRKSCLSLEVLVLVTHTPTTLRGARTHTETLL